MNNSIDTANQSKINISTKLKLPINSKIRHFRNVYNNYLPAPCSFKLKLCDYVKKDTYILILFLNR